jgi:hypothetical protein
LVELWKPPEKRKALPPKKEKPPEPVLLTTDERAMVLEKPVPVPVEKPPPRDKPVLKVDEPPIDPAFDELLGRSSAPVLSPDGGEDGVAI